MWKYIKGIPNVVEFKMKEKIIDTFALSVFNILRNQESRFVKVQGTKKLAKSNKYLDHQFRRLEKYASKGELKKFNFLARILVRKSKVMTYYAMKFVYPKLLRANTVKAVWLWRRSRALCLNESTDLKYKRVWMTDPGKQDTFTRPLGVPTPEWRIYGHILTKIMEVYLNGRGLLHRNQHGGKARFGTLSFLREFAKKLETANSLLEFDIKGFFNNVSHASMLELLEGCYLKDQMADILKCKPETYTLPPKSEDPVLLLNEIQREYDDQLAVKREKAYWKYRFLDIKESFERQARGRVDVTEWAGNLPTAGPRPFDSIIDKIKAKKAEHYKEKMERLGLYDNYTVGFVSISEKDRSIGRDMWKGLGKDNCGVPQGTAFGPLLASAVLGHCLRHLKALIYMDDGVIFAKNNKEAERNRVLLKNKLKRIGCEVADGKTHVLDAKALITAGVKILGTRWTQVRTLFSYNCRSETRKGVSRPFINVRTENILSLVDRMYEAGIMSFSKNQVFWREMRGTYVKDTFDDILLGIAVKHEIFGSILAKAYSPESDIASMVREIQYGIFKAEAKLAKYPWHSIEKKLYRKYQTRYVSEGGNLCTTRITLQNVSTLSNDIFMSFINKDLPVRSKLIYNFYPKKVRKAVVKRIVNSGLRFR